MSPHLTRAAGRAAALVALVTLLLGCQGTASASPATPSAGATSASAETPAAPSSDPVEAAAMGSWRPAPYPFTGARPFVDRIERACRAAEPAIGDTPIVIRDVRGLSQVLLLLADDSAAWACFAPLDAVDHSQVTIREMNVPDDPIGDEKLDLVLYEAFESSTGDARRAAIGRVGRSGIRVVAGFDDESEVLAAKDGGWWTMWWPTDVDPAVIAVTDRQSIAMDALPAPRN